MKNGIGPALVLAVLVFIGASVSAGGSDQAAHGLPQPGVPQIMTMEGKFVRAAYNNEGYVILGYQAANRSIGEEWMLLEIGVTLRETVPAFKLTRDALSIETPDGKTIPLPTVTEFRAANTSALQNRAKVQRDSINYFPPGATGRAASVLLRSGFSSDGVRRGRVELRPRLPRPALFPRAGRHHVGQHWLNVKFRRDSCACHSES